MADIVKLSSLERTKPVLGGFVKTEAAVDIQRTLHLLQATGHGRRADGADRRAARVWQN